MQSNRFTFEDKVSSVEESQYFLENGCPKTNHKHKFYAVGNTKVAGGQILKKKCSHCGTVYNLGLKVRPAKFCLR